MLLELTTEQATALRELVANAIGEIADEARHTDASRYREELRELERTLGSVLALLDDERPTEVG